MSEEQKLQEWLDGFRLAYAERLATIDAKLEDFQDRVGKQISEVVSIVGRDEHMDAQIQGACAIVAAKISENPSEPVATEEIEDAVEVVLRITRSLKSDRGLL